jgi:hypothetical protein
MNSKFTALIIAPKVGEAKDFAQTYQGKVPNLTLKSTNINQYGDEQYVSDH